MDIKAILQRNIGTLVGQYIVAVSELEAACVAKDAEIATLRKEGERTKAKKSRDKGNAASSDRPVR